MNKEIDLTIDEIVIADLGVKKPTDSKSHGH